MVEFPDIMAEYQASELFPLFANRVMSSRRSDYNEFVQLLGLEHSESPLFAFQILDRTGGRTAADRYRMFLEPEIAANQPFEIRFFVAGQSRDKHSQSGTKWASMKVGEELTLRTEPDNKFSKTAVQICLGDFSLGYVPDYYAAEVVHRLLALGRQLVCRLVQVNPHGAPQDRILVSVKGVWPDIPLPFHTGDYSSQLREMATL